MALVSSLFLMFLISSFISFLKTFFGGFRARSAAADKEAIRFHPVQS